MRNMIKTMIGVFAVVGLMALPQAAQAGGTAPNTTITNLATLNFTVGGNAQPAVQSNGGTTTDFVVDKAINVAVANADGAAVAVNPGQTGAALKFTVTNLGNAATQDILLQPVAVATGNPAKFGGNDNADMLNVDVYADTNNSGVFDAGDTLLPLDAVSGQRYIDELAPDTPTTVFVVANAPNTLVNGDIASYHLTATVAVGGTVGAAGAAEVATNGANGLLGLDVGFADAQGTDPAELATPDGKHSDQGDYVVQSAVISVAKTVSVQDPYGTNNAIPGATVTYTITITNAATATASAVLTTLNDPLNANLTAVTTLNAASWTVTGSTRGVTTGTLTLDNNAADGLSLTGTTVTYDFGIILGAQAGPPAYAAGELKPGESVSVTFQATIN